MRRTELSPGIVPVSIRTLLVIAGLAGLLACGCSDSSTAPAKPAPSLQEGALSLVVTGLPASTNSDVDVAGPSSYARHLTSSALLNGVPAGACTIFAKPVANAQGDTLFPTPISQTTTVTVADTTVVQVNYAGSAATTVRVFHGPFKDTESQTSNHYVALEDWGQPLISLRDADTVVFPYPFNYILDQNCRVIGNEITATGLTINSSISTMFGTGSSSSQLNIFTTAKAMALI